jgi:hypothetical protein
MVMRDSTPAPTLIRVTSALESPRQVSSAILYSVVTSRTNSHVGLLTIRKKKTLPFFTVTSVTSVTLPLIPLHRPVHKCYSCQKLQRTVTNCNFALLILVRDKRLPFFTATSTTSATLPHKSPPRACSQILRSLRIATNCNKPQHSLFLALCSHSKQATRRTCHGKFLPISRKTYIDYNALNEVLQNLASYVLLK